MCTTNDSPINLRILPVDTDTGRGRRSERERLLLRQQQVDLIGQEPCLGGHGTCFHGDVYVYVYVCTKGSVSHGMNSREPP